jgi:hypothetical protein
MLRWARPICDSRGRRTQLYRQIHHWIHKFSNTWKSQFVMSSAVMLAGSLCRLAYAHCVQSPTASHVFLVFPRVEDGSSSPSAAWPDPPSSPSLCQVYTLPRHPYLPPPLLAFAPHVCEKFGSHFHRAYLYIQTWSAGKTSNLKVMKNLLFGTVLLPPIGNKCRKFRTNLVQSL